MPRHATPRHALLLLRLRLLRLEVREGGEADVEEEEEEEEEGGGLWCSAVQRSVSRHDDQTHIYMSVYSRVHKNVLLARGTWECTSVLSHARKTHGASSSSSSSS